MSRRQVIILVIFLFLIGLLGFVFGQRVLPGILLRFMDHKQEPLSDGLGVAAAQGVFHPSARLHEPAASSGSGDSGSQIKHDGHAPSGEYPEEMMEKEDGSDEPDTLGAGDPNFENIIVDVDVTQQLVRIFKGEQVIREMVASTGREGHETPLGTFEIQNRGTWFYSDKYKQGAKYWVSFKGWGLYLFHSLAMDEDRQVIQEEADLLGRPVSHGCVRLSIEDAKWIYENVPQNTKVMIHN